MDQVGYFNRLKSDISQVEPVKIRWHGKLHLRGEGCMVTVSLIGACLTNWCIL